MTEELLGKVFEEKQAPCPKTIKLFPLKSEYTLNTYIQFVFTPFIKSVALGCARTARLMKVVQKKLSKRKSGLNGNLSLSGYFSSLNV
jgi:hypothetical protein